MHVQSYYIYKGENHFLMLDSSIYYYFYLSTWRIVLSSEFSIQWIAAGKACVTIDSDNG